MSEQPLLDLSMLAELERCLGRERVIRVVSAQITNACDLSRRMSALELAPDPDRVSQLAHQVAGSSGAIGLARLSDEAAKLERAAIGAEVEALAVLVRGLRLCLESSQAALRAQYPEIADR